MCIHFLLVVRFFCSGTNRRTGLDAAGWCRTHTETRGTPTLIGRERWHAWNALWRIFPWFWLGGLDEIHMVGPAHACLDKKNNEFNDKRHVRNQYQKALVTNLQNAWLSKNMFNVPSAVACRVASASNEGVGELSPLGTGLLDCAIDHFRLENSFRFSEFLPEHCGENKEPRLDKSLAERCGVRLERDVTGLPSCGASPNSKSRFW